MRKYFIILLMIIVLSISVSAQTTEYTVAGTIDSDWETDGAGIFSSEIDITTFPSAFTTTHHMPLADDLDNDNLTEIVVVSSNSVTVMNGKELTVKDTISLGSIFSRVSNVMLFDIDGDNFSEIIFHENGNSKLRILNYSASAGIQNQSSFTISLGAVDVGMIGCSDVNKCIMTKRNRVTENIFNPFIGNHTAVPFDSNGVTGSDFEIYSEFQPSGDAIAICSPRIKNIPAVDIDGDGVKELGVAFAVLQDSSTSVTYKVEWLDNTTSELSISESHTVPDRDMSSCSGTDGGSNYITSPVAGELYNTESNLETVIGYQTDQEDFRMGVFRESDGARIDQYPALLEANGIIISNPVIGNFFPETGAIDICVLGHDSTNDKINLLCGTRYRGFGIVGSDEFEYSITGLYNVSNDITNIYNAIHGSQMSNEPTDGVDLNEIISTYGVFKIDYEGVNELLRLWENPAGESILYPIDVEGVGSDDLIAMTDSNVFYFDDKLGRENAVITDVTFNPCPINSIIKLNTTMSVSVVVTDNNPAVIGQDPVNVNVSVYEGDTNEQTGGAVGVTSGSSQPFIFNMNKTGNNFVIQMLGDDDFSSKTDSQTQTFTVANEGVEFGDTECTSQFVVEEDTTTIVTGGSLNETSNVGSQALGLLSSTGLGGTGNWLLIMGFVAFLFIFGTKVLGKEVNNLDPKLLFTALILVEVLLLFFGVVIGAIPVGVVIALVVIALIPLSLWVRNLITGVNNGNGGL